MLTDNFLSHVDALRAAGCGDSAVICPGRARMTGNGMNSEDKRRRLSRIWPARGSAMREPIIPLFLRI